MSEQNSNTVTNEIAKGFTAFLEDAPDPDVSHPEYVEVTSESTDVIAGQVAEEQLSSQQVVEPVQDQPEQKADQEESILNETLDPVEALKQEIAELKKLVDEEKNNSRNARAGMSKAFEAQKAMQRKLEELSTNFDKPAEEKRTDKFLELYDKRLEEAKTKFKSAEEQDKYANFHASLDLVKEEVKGDLKTMVDDNPWVKAIQTEADAEVQKNLLNFQRFMAPIFNQNKELHQVWQLHLVQRMRELGYVDAQGKPDFVRFEKTPESVSIAYQAAKYAQGVTGKTNIQIPNNPSEFEKVLAYKQGKADAAQNQKRKSIQTADPKGTGQPMRGKDDDGFELGIINARR